MYKNLNNQKAVRQFRVQFTNQTGKMWNLTSCHCAHGIYDAQFPSQLNPGERIKINGMSNGFMTGVEFCFTFKMIDEQEQLQFSGLADNPYIGTDKVALSNGKLGYKQLRQYMNQKSPIKLQIGKIDNITYYATFSFIKGDRATGDVRIIEEIYYTKQYAKFKQSQYPQYTSKGW